MSSQRLANVRDIAVVQLVSWGDVVISTSLVHAIKEQLGVKITYYVSSACHGAVFGNPDIDQIKIIQATKHQAWGVFSKIIKQAWEFHQHVFTPWPGFIPRHEWCLLDRQTKINFMWSYARAGQVVDLTIDVPLKLYLYLSDSEKERADKFYRSLNKKPSTKLVLAEMHGDSSQTACCPAWIPSIVNTVMTKYNGDAIVCISASGQPPREIQQLITKYDRKIQFLNFLSLREVSAFFNYCDIFLGVSSGTSNACHGHQCKKDIAWFETVNDPVWDSSPLGVENKVFYYGTKLAEYISILKGRLP